MERTGINTRTTPFNILSKKEETGYVYDDTAIAGLSLPPSGVAAPEMKMFKGASGTFSDYAIHFDGTNPNATLSNNPAYDFSAQGNFTFECWIKPTNSTFNLLFQQGVIDIYYGNNSLSIGVNGAYKYMGDSLGLNARNHVVITFEKIGTQTEVKYYLNGRLGSTVKINRTFSNSTGDIYIGSYFTSSYDLKGDMDEILFYDFPLNPLQILERNNLGMGTTSLPSGVDYTTVGARAVGHFACNENTGTTVVNENTATGDSMTINANATWVTGLIGSNTGTFGYYAWHFPPNQDTMLTINQKILHKFKLESDSSPHAHWSPVSDLGNAKVVWEIGFTFSVLGGMFPDITVYQSFDEQMGVTDAFSHLITAFQDIDMATNTSVSTIIGGYIARRGTHTNDTYNDDAALHYIGSYMKIDQLGSREKYVKY